ncbi:MAG TPA: hypothetical protein DEW46_12640, partial [Verrucomicrobia bacterium]|nr:hypothetical protein [Verrucomicrobiota bacterium]
TGIDSDPDPDLLLVLVLVSAPSAPSAGVLLSPAISIFRCGPKRFSDGLRQPSREAAKGNRAGLGENACRARSFVSSAGFLICGFFGFRSMTLGW